MKVSLSVHLAPATIAVRSHLNGAHFHERELEQRKGRDDEIEEARHAALDPERVDPGPHRRDGHAHDLARRAQLGQHLA